MHYSFRPSGVCAQKIDFDIVDGKLSTLVFQGGCNGNLKAISRLVEGKEAQEVASVLKGNTCGYKSTSCADQLSIAITQALGAKE